jgi:hypothetical protein
VANKVHFTNSAKEMEEFIPLKHIPKDLDGEEDWTYSYVEPREGENAAMLDTATRDRLLAERAKLYKEYEDATLEWINTPSTAGEAAEKIKARRNDIAARLRADYWNLDPYVRARSYYDRIGVLQPGGKLDWYPGEKEKEKVAEKTAAGGAAAAAGEETKTTVSGDEEKKAVEAVATAMAQVAVTTSAADVD